MYFDGFSCFNKNRQTTHMGGGATCIANKDSIDTLKVSEGANNEEYIVTRNSQFTVPLNIMNV